MYSKALSMNISIKGTVRIWKKEFVNIIPERQNPSSLSFLSDWFILKNLKLRRNLLPERSILNQRQGEGFLKRQCHRSTMPARLNIVRTGIV